jgi:hypothetical protein
MPPAMAELILGVDPGWSKTCQQFIQGIWYKTSALSIVTMANEITHVHLGVMETVDRFSQHRP